MVRRRRSERLLQLRGPSLAGKANDIALIWEGDSPDDQRLITFAELKDNVCRLANALTNECVVGKGDRVIIYMPMIPEAVSAMLACARIGRCVWRFFAAVAVRPDPRLRGQRGDHG